MSLDEIKENFSKIPIIIRILFILLILAFIYDLVTGKAFSIYFSITLLLFIIAMVVNWFKNRS